MLRRRSRQVFWQESCATANSYYFDNHGDVPLRAATTLETMWRSSHFDLGDYRFTAADRRPARAIAWLFLPVTTGVFGFPGRGLRDTAPGSSPLAPPARPPALDAVQRYPIEPTTPGTVVGPTGAAVDEGDGEREVRRSSTARSAKRRVFRAVRGPR